MIIVITPSTLNPTELGIQILLENTGDTQRLQRAMESIQPRIGNLPSSIAKKHSENLAAIDRHPTIFTVMPNQEKGSNLQLAFLAALKLSPDISEEIKEQIGRQVSSLLHNKESKDAIRVSQCLIRHMVDVGNLIISSKQQNVPQAYFFDQNRKVMQRLNQLNHGNALEYDLNGRRRHYQPLELIEAAITSRLKEVRKVMENINWRQTSMSESEIHTIRLRKFQNYQLIIAKLKSLYVKAEKNPAFERYADQTSLLLNKLIKHEDAISNETDKALLNLVKKLEENKAQNPIQELHSLNQQAEKDISANSAAQAAPRNAGCARP